MDTPIAAFSADLRPSSAELSSSLGGPPRKRVHLSEASTTVNDITPINVAIITALS